MHKQYDRMLKIIYDVMYLIFIKIGVLLIKYIHSNVK
jgi:hypothetical protein